jgi:hypothetical protein
VQVRHELPAGMCVIGEGQPLKGGGGDAAPCSWVPPVGEAPACFPLAILLEGIP